MAQDDRNKPGRPQERPTLKTISRLTGLAVATVSRALSDAPDIGEDTKKRVRETAARVGYRPNRAGVRLRTGKTNVISLVMSTDHDMMNHTARLISSVAATLRGTPYHMIMTPFFPGEDPMIPVRYIVETGSADGVILNQTQPRDPRVEYLMARGFPFATHGRSDWCDEHAYFDFDNRAFAEIALGELFRRGRRDILLVLPPLAQNYAMEMREGAEAAARAAGLRVRLLRTATGDDPARHIEDAVATELRAAPGIDGVMTSSTNACMAITAAAERTGRVLGRDFDVAAKEAIPFLNTFRPPIIAVFEDIARAGTFVTRALMQRIADPDAPPMQQLDRPAPFGAKGC